MMIRNPTDKAIPCPDCGNDERPRVLNCERCHGTREIWVEDDEGWNVHVVEPDDADDAVDEAGARNR